jgi:hypothetical protein
MRRTRRVACDLALVVALNVAQKVVQECSVGGLASHTVLIYVIS